MLYAPISAHIKRKLFLEEELNSDKKNISFLEVKINSDRNI